MVLSERALTTSYRLSMSNHVSICSGLAEIFNKMFQAISGYISESVRYSTMVTINH